MTSDKYKPSFTTIGLNIFDRTSPLVTEFVVLLVRTVTLTRYKCLKIQSASERLAPPAAILSITFIINWHVVNTSLRKEYQFSEKGTNKPYSVVR